MYHNVCVGVTGGLGDLSGSGQYDPPDAGLQLSPPGIIICTVHSRSMQ